MESVVSRMSSDDLAFVIFMTVLCMTGMIISLGALWLNYRRTELEIALKQDMLSRGMTTEDIERVMRASASKGCDTSLKA